MGNLHPQAIEHARHTARPPGGRAAKGGALALQRGPVGLLDPPAIAGRVPAFVLALRPPALHIEWASYSGGRSRSRTASTVKSYIGKGIGSRNQGFTGTMNGKCAALCDGNKTMPNSPWPLGAMSRLSGCCGSRREARRLIDWLPRLFDAQSAAPRDLRGRPKVCR